MKFFMIVLSFLFFFVYEAKAEGIGNTFLQVGEEELNPAQIFEQEMLAKKKSYSKSKSKKSAKRGSGSSRRSSNSANKSKGSKNSGSIEPSLTSGMFIK